jgi:ABC-type nitrate/sulfonate/bicarbonate transport system permease component
VETTARDARPLELKPVPFSRVGATMWRRGAATRSTLLALLIGACAWELAGRLWRMPFLPPFSSVVRAAAQLIAGGQILGYLAASILALLLGYGLAVVAGVTLGLLMGRYRKVEYALDLYVNALLATPKIALVPVLFALFGIGHSVQVAIVFLSAFCVIVINTMSAIQNVDASYIEMARSFGASERQLFVKVLLPGSLPLTMAGLRMGMGRAVKGMINGEMLIAVFGLGGLLSMYGSRFDAERVFAILLVVVSVALVCSFVVQSIERRATRWMEPGS